MSVYRFEEDNYRPDSRFIPLGIHPNSLNDSQRRQLLNKISGKRKASLSFAWGTLGWGNDRAFAESGTVFSSTYGNKAFEGTARGEIDLLKQSTAESPRDKNYIERYINFDKVDFGFDKERYALEDLPFLRLSLFLNPDQGALVYYEMCDKCHLEKPFNDPARQAEIAYIQPEPTDEYHSTARDRLNYFFRILPPKGFVPEEENGNFLQSKTDETGVSFVVKIIVFKRAPIDSHKLVAKSTIGLLEKQSRKSIQCEEEFYERYRILRFEDEFKCIDPKEIDFNAKTLLLVHGTFSNTLGSFGELAGRDGFLRHLMEKGTYGQILAFDHSTILDSVDENCRRLYQFLAPNSFKQELDLIGTSRGALVCRFLSIDKGNTYFKSGKIISFSGAFGVDYVRVIKGIETMLRAYRTIFPQSAAILVILAQHSAKAITELPGISVLHRDHPLNILIRNTPHLDNHTKELFFQADWHSSLPQNKIVMLKYAKFLLDLAMRLIMGKEHDWVIRYAHQIPDLQNTKGETIRLKSVHTKHFDLGYPKPDPRISMMDFLSDPSENLLV